MASASGLSNRLRLGCAGICVQVRDASGQVRRCTNSVKNELEMISIANLPNNGLAYATTRLQGQWQGTRFAWCELTQGHWRGVSTKRGWFAVTIAATMVGPEKPIIWDGLARGSPLLVLVVLEMILWSGKLPHGMKRWPLDLQDPLLPSQEPSPSDSRWCKGLYSRQCVATLNLISITCLSWIQIVQLHL